MADYASEAGHWYTKDGLPAYEMVGANGKLRKTTLRDARKYNYRVGVSDIIKCASAYQLEKWKIKRGIRTTLAIPYSGEDAEEYVERVYADCEAQGREVMDLGSAIHGCIECHLLEKPYDKTHADSVMGALGALCDWCGMDGIRPERSFAHDLGFGGKCDIHKLPLPVDTGWVADFKSKDFGEGELPAVYDNHSMQLSAYRHGFGIPHARCAIIYVSTKIPGLTRLVEVGQDELSRGWEMFKTLLAYWKLKNNYQIEGSDKNDLLA